jgi:hypothetical protein
MSVGKELMLEAMALEEVRRWSGQEPRLGTWEAHQAMFKALEIWYR